MKTRILWTLLIAVGLLLVIQLIRPLKRNPPVNPQIELSAVHPVNAEVTAILQRSCSDCHSNRTVWPAYSHVAPASWLVASDVHRGRRAMNFSEWGSYAPGRSQKLLREICTEVTEGEMPGTAYKLMHPSAKLSPAEVQSVCRWTQTIGSSPASIGGAE
jgi:hypothetical protein